PKKPKRASRSKKAVEAVAAETVAEVVTEAPVKDPAPVEPAPAATAPAASEEEASVRSNRRKPAAVDAPVVPVISSSVSDEAKAEDKPKRAGWWQRKGFF
ncbi:MAG: hypothetical protein EOS45_30455, partial [Mesorhizobium sp.]